MTADPKTTACPCNPESAALCEEHCPHYAHTAAEIKRLRAQMERMIVEVSRWSIAASEEMEAIYRGR
jgi:hypothetical protein